MNFLIAPVVCLLLSAPLYAKTYAMDPDHSQGVVSWNHLGFSNPTAKFSSVKGTLEYDEQDPAKDAVRVTIPLSSLATGVPELDDDFRSADYFNIARFATATYSSTKVERGRWPDELIVTGTLGLHGISKPVVLTVTVNKVGIDPRDKKPSVGFEATGSLKRLDFGLGRWVPEVSDEIKIHITCQAMIVATTS